MVSKNRQSDDNARLLNLSRKDLASLPSEKLIDIIAWQQTGMEILDDKLKKAEVEALQMRSIVNKLSIDPGTGIFTVGALAIMTDILIGSRILEFLKIQGFSLRICVLDVDELKKHNSMGGHDAGDTVLREVASRLRMLYRRRSDVVAQGLADLVGDARVVVGREGIDIGVARAEKGDEMVAWRFAAPTKNDVQRGGWRVSSEVARVKRGFEGATVSYPLLQGLTPEHIKRIDPHGRFKVRSGIVTAPVSVTFVCVYSPMPINRNEVRRVIRRADEVVVMAKHERGTEPPSENVGIALTLDEDSMHL